MRARVGRPEPSGEQEKERTVAKHMQNLEYEKKTMIQKQNATLWGMYSPNENTTIAFRTAVWLAPSAADTIVCLQIACLLN